MFLLILCGVAVTLVVGGRKTLKPIAHLLSLLLMLPGLLFACACLFLDHAVRRGAAHGLPGFLDAVFSLLEVMMPWGLTVFVVCLCGLAAAGLRAKWRRWAAGMVVALVVGSTGVVLWAAGWPEEAGQCWFLAPGLVAALTAGWLVCAPQRGAREFDLAYPGGLRISRALRREALEKFRGEAGFEARDMGNGWTWYHLPSFQDGAVRMGVVLGFHGETLQQIDLFHDEPAVYDENSEEKERRRAEVTRSWVVGKGFPTGSYPWGEIWSGWDAKAAFGGVGIRYAAIPCRV